LRNNRTPAPDPPAVVAIIYQKAGGPGNVSLLDFRLPVLPPILEGYPDVFVDGQELDFGQDPGARGDDFVNDSVYSNDDDKTNNDVDCDDEDNEDGSDYSPEKGKNEDPNRLDCSSEDDNDNLVIDADLEEFELVDFADPNGGNKDDWRRYKDGPMPPDYAGMSYIEKKLANDEYNIIMRNWIDQQRKLRLKCKAEVDIDWTGVGTSTL
jgi:hypothetical protein